MTPALAPALALLLASSPAAAATYNVSALVLGEAERMPTATTQLPCGSQCTWASASGALMDNAYQVAPGALTLAAWPPVWTAAKPAVANVDLPLAVPAPPTGSTWGGLPGGAQQRAEVHYNVYPMLNARRDLSVQTFRTGSGAAVVSYAVRIVTPIGLARPTFVAFTVPELLRTFATATNPLSGPSGYQPETAYPTLQSMRSAVDVVVDGLVVWSSESNHLKPQRYPSAKTPLLLKTGAALGTGTSTLFLGSLLPKSVTHVQFVLRSDARITAPECKNDNSGSSTVRRCHAHREALSMPSSAEPGAFGVLRPAISVYTY